MKIYRITKSYSNENGEYGGPVVWFHLFRRAAIRLAGRIAQDFAGKNAGRGLDDPDTVVTRFINPKNEHYVAVDIVPLNIFAPFFAARRWFRQRCHWQNLNTKWAGHKEIPVGSILRHGRAWFHRKDRHSIKHGSGDLFHVEWSILHSTLRSWSLSFDLFDGDSESDILMSISTPLFSFYFILEGVIPRRWAKNHTWSHNTGVTWMEGALHLEIYSCGNDCYYCDGWKDHPKRWTGWSYWVHPRDLIMGRTDYKSEIVETYQTEVAMPEKTYPATVKIEKTTWTRRRWPFSLYPRVRLSAQIEVEGGVPVPGKGENSWDCGEDAIFSTGSSTPTVSAAVASLVTSALRTRERHGGPNWRPSERLTA